MLTATVLQHVIEILKESGKEMSVFDIKAAHKKKYGVSLIGDSLYKATKRALEMEKPPIKQVAYGKFLINQ